MATQMGVITFKLQHLQGVSNLLWSVSPNLVREGKPMNPKQAHGWPQFTDVRGKWRLVMWFNLTEEMLQLKPLKMLILVYMDTDTPTPEPVHPT